MIIINHPNYSIKENGIITNINTGKQKTQVLDAQTGYYKVILWTNNEYKSYNVHFLIAIHFIAPVEGKTHVNHKNGIKTDNRIENLEWCTRAENCQHSINILGNNVGHKSPNYVGAVHTEYGFFCTTKEAAAISGVSKSCMINWLNGLFPNKSKFIWSE